MRKRVAAKVMRRQDEAPAAYRGATITRARALFLRAADRDWERRNMVPIHIVVQPQEGAVRPARPA